MLLKASPKKSGPEREPGGLSGTKVTTFLVCLIMFPPASCSPLASNLPKTLLCPVHMACQVLTWAFHGHRIMSPTCLSGFVSDSPFSLEEQTWVASFQPSLTSKLTLEIFFFLSRMYYLLKTGLPVHDEAFPGPSCLPFDAQNPLFSLPIALTTSSLEICS